MHRNPHNLDNNFQTYNNRLNIYTSLNKIRALHFFMRNHSTPHATTCFRWENPIPCENYDIEFDYLEFQRKTNLFYLLSFVVGRRYCKDCRVNRIHYHISYKRLDYYQYTPSNSLLGNLCC